jgi:hypothetical protein
MDGAKVPVAPTLGQHETNTKLKRIVALIRQGTIQYDETASKAFLSGNG